MQKRHTLQGARARAEQPASDPESEDSGMRLKRAENLEETSTPAAPPPIPTKVVEISLPPALPESQAAGKPPRWLGPIALALGVVCLALACWLQVH